VVCCAIFNDFFNFFLKKEKNCLLERKRGRVLHLLSTGRPGGLCVAVWRKFGPRERVRWALVRL
jgi:hypothetical protein